MSHHRLATLAFAIAALAALAPLSARADSITATVTVDTSGMTGAGPFEIFFQLNQGSLGSSATTITLSDFILGGGSAGAIDSANTAGDATGTMASSIVLDDGLATSYLTQFLTPGSSLAFDISATFVPVVPPDTPDLFSFSLVDNGEFLPTTAGDGSNSLVEINFDGASPTANAYPGSGSDTSGNGVGAVVYTPAAPATVPEPAPLLLLATGLALLAIRRR